MQKQTTPEVPQGLNPALNSFLRWVREQLKGLALEKAKETAETATSKAGKAQASADGATDAAAKAQETADGAVVLASSAQASADSAYAVANEAKSTANTAKQDANAAHGIATEAYMLAQKADISNRGAVRFDRDQTLTSARQERARANINAAQDVMATTSTGGQVVIGGGLDVNESGTVSLSPATTSSLGGVIIGTGINVTSDGTISVSGGDYLLPAATTSSLGGVIVGSGLGVTGTGLLSVASGFVTSGSLAAVAMTGDYGDLENKPSIPPAVVVDSALSSSSTNPVQNKVVYSSLAGKADSSHTHPQYLTEHQSLADYVKSSSLATVASTGSYNDLADKPAIPGSYVLPDATTTSKGGVIVGSGLNVSSGKISVAGSYATSANVSSIISSGGYATSSYVGDAVSSAVSGKITSAQAIQAVSSGGYVTSTWVSSRGYVTSSYVSSATVASAGHATTADTATKIGSLTIGGETKPVYVSSGTVVSCTYSLGKSVPADAVFTDTVFDDSDVVHISGTETITGLKTFTSNPHVEKAGPLLYLNRIYEGEAPTDVADVRFQNNGDNEAVIRLTLDQNLQLGAKGDGAGWYNGPSLMLKKDNTFSLRSGYGGTTHALVGSADGILTWKNKAIAIDENVVHKTGDETVGGNKTFSSRITLNGPMSGRGIDYVANTLVKGNNPSSDQSMNLCFFDKNGYSSSQNNFFGVVGIQQLKNNGIRNRLVAYQNVAGSTNGGVVGAGVDADGVAYAYATSTSSSRTDGNDVVTRNWIPNDTRIVHTTGDEDIDGKKTFAKTVYYNFFQVFKYGFTHGTNPSAWTHRSIYFSDKTGGEATTDLIGMVRSSIGTNGATRTQITAVQNVNTSPAVATIDVNVALDGTMYATAPSTSTSRTNGTDIVTRDFIPNDTRIVHTSGDESITGQKTINTLVITGAGNLRKTDDTHDLWLCGGTANTTDHGAYIGLYGATNSGSYPGFFSIATGKVNNKYAQLLGNPDGTLTWGGKEFVYTSGNQTVAGNKTFTNSITEAASYPAITINRTYSESTPSNPSDLRFANNGNNEAEIRLTTSNDLQIGIKGSGANWYNGPSLMLKNDNTFELRSGYGGTTYKLIGSASGGLTWNNKGFVYDSGNQTIAGAKTFSSNVTVYKDFAMKNASFASRGTTPSAAQWWSAYFSADNNDALAGIWHNISTSNVSVTEVRGYHNNATTSYARFWIQVKADGTKETGIDASIFRPAVSTYPSLGGTGTQRWSHVYATDTTITTSDERKKTTISDIPDAVLDAWGDVAWQQFQMQDAVVKKGENARLHTGAIAQRIEDAFKAHGLDANRYGLFCYDEWDATEAQYNEKGEILEQAIEAGNEYSLRYEEALCMEAAYQRRRADRAEARLSDLERRLDEMEAVMATLGGGE